MHRPPVLSTLIFHRIDMRFFLFESPGPVLLPTSFGRPGAYRKGAKKNDLPPEN